MTRWKCQCACGATPLIHGTSLRKAGAQSCGCKTRAAIGQRSTTHGATKGGSATPEFRAWSHAKARCGNPKDTSYADYGGRGITMCDRWKNSFDAFLKDMGPRPDGTTLDRRNNDGPYSPDNCRWADRSTQVRNRRVSVEVEYLGGVWNLTTLAEQLGINYKLLVYFYRIRKLSIDEAVGRCLKKSL